MDQIAKVLSVGVFAALAAAATSVIAGESDGAASAVVTVAPAGTRGAFGGCKSFPSDGACNFKDPQAEGCDADARTLSSAEIPGVVRAALRYSPSCQSAWTRAINLTNVGGRSITAQASRKNGFNGGIDLVTSRAAFYPNTTVLSPMVFLGANHSARALATLQESDGRIVNQVQTNFAR